MSPWGAYRQGTYSECHVAVLAHTEMMTSDKKTDHCINKRSLPLGVNCWEELQYCNNGLPKHNQPMRDACEQSGVFFVTTLQGWAYNSPPTCVMHDSSQTFSLLQHACLQGWVYKTRQHEIDAGCIMIVSCFLCGNIARMGSQNNNRLYTPKRRFWTVEQTVWFEALFSE